MAIDTTHGFKKFQTFFFSMGDDVYITCHILVKTGIVGHQSPFKGCNRLPYMDTIYWSIRAKSLCK